ncbi:PAS domain-containing protein [Sulfurimonas autotrophica]|uniref:PAS fold domain-containing protein n=1 Tax=Sulfurimonas autotrophica (strain ATCC BAA-671 / DSM 16294 / JCM 11897 / OK10) TaxID=563040 RepID=E0US05_SULAO|nr:PAS domain-containing protein [Sulfurimonas autotrophica]ADN09028.1 hypothetical protein Saut_0979 [Sulfurimonas autotrophica DSM 16294]
MLEKEKILDDEDFLVSTTDKKGVITYTNFGFANMAEYPIEELYGKPHNIVRHPGMPKAVFKLMWQKLLNKEPVVAYVKNLTSNKESFYWVKAFIFPVVKNNEIAYITSYRTKPSRFAVDQIEKVYSQVSNYEQGHSIDESLQFLNSFLEERNLTYESFINRLNTQKQILNSTLLNMNLSKYKADHIAFKSNIESQVKRGVQNIEVTESCCCAFGKTLESYKNEPFAKDRLFSTLKKLHDGVHSNLKTYTTTEASQRPQLESDISRDTQELFEALNGLVDNFVEQ